MAAASFNQMRVQTHCQSRLRRRAADKTVWGRERYRLQTLLPSIGQLCDRMWAARGRTVANCETNAAQRDEKPKLVGDSTGASAIGISIAFQCSS